MSLLGALILDDSGIIEEVSKIVGGGAFFRPAHCLLFEALVDLHDSGRPCDLVILKSALEDRGTISEVGGIEYCESLVVQVPTAAHALEYALIVRDMSQRRRALAAALRFTEILQTCDELNDGFNELREALDTLQGESRSYQDAGPWSLKDLIALVKSAGEVEIIPPIFPGLPEGLGHAAGRVTIVGAFTGGGKTTTCTAEAIHLARLGHPVLIVTAEISRLEYTRKILAACVEDPATLPISILEVHGKIAHLECEIRRWAKRLNGGKAPAVIIDYLQRLSVDNASSREREVAEAAERLQNLSRTLRLIVVLAAQLNRRSQTETRPALHHFRESGLIEQVADLALLTGRTGPDRMYVLVGKNRWGSGAGEEVNLIADFAHCRFGILTEAQIVEPLVRGVIEYVKSKGGQALLKDVCKYAGSGERGRHPRKGQVIEAARVSSAFRIEGAAVVLS